MFVNELSSKASKLSQRRRFWFTSSRGQLQSPQLHNFSFQLRHTQLKLRNALDQSFIVVNTGTGPPAAQ
jgi:hypothetical protein